MRRITDYSRFLTRASKLRKPSPIRALMPLINTPGMISLGGGMPNPSTFPFESATFTTRDGAVLKVSEADMKMALQYSPTPGLPPLISWISEMMMRVHQPVQGLSAVNLILSTGSQDIMSMTFEMLIERGDHVFVESPTYTGALSALKPLECHLHAVRTDGLGIVPSDLEVQLRAWKDESTRPKVLYLIPNGGNPTGVTLTLERKRELYALAREFDLLILEDDPYYFLQFSEPTPSLFSMDEDGRVLRFDSFSKVVSSGLRIGYATGPKPLIERLELHGQASYLHPSGLSQVALLTYLRHVGQDGFLEHTRKVADFYRQRCDVFSAGVRKHLAGLVEMEEPAAGMFAWMKLLGTNDAEPLIKSKAVEKKVLLVPGQAFMPDGKPTPYVRASFSTATDDEIDLALSRLAELIRENMEQPAK